MITVLSSHPQERTGLRMGGEAMKDTEVGQPGGGLEEVSLFNKQSR